jgi:hypothetical protein
MGKLEFTALAHLNDRKCPNIVELLEYCYDNSHLVLVFPRLSQVSITTVAQLHDLMRDLLQV